MEILWKCGQVRDPNHKKHISFLFKIKYVTKQHHNEALECCRDALAMNLVPQMQANIMI